MWLRLIKCDELFINFVQGRSIVVKEYQGCSRLDISSKGKVSIIDIWLWIITGCHEGSGKIRLRVGLFNL